MIAGNEAAHIGRMLDSFEGCFDELSLAIATGAEYSDETYSIAQNWCDAKGKAFTGSHYENTMAAQHWPHVDSFAAARNQSMRQAKGRWLLWADCDDLFKGDPAELRRILAEPNAADIHHFPYEVPGVGKVTRRERAFRAELLAAGAGWHYPVHENFRAYDHHAHALHHSPRWVHDPLPCKPQSGKRNLRILTEALADAPAYMFYVAQDWYFMGNADNAKRFGDLFLAMPGADPSMRYQMHLCLAKIERLKSEGARHAMAAYWLFPYREAAAALVTCAFQENDGAKALHWAEVLVNTALPDVPLWCHEPRWYGWHGDDLYLRAVRLAKGDEAADEVTQIRCAGQRINHVVFHATTAESDRAIPMRDAWMTCAANPYSVRHIFIVDEDKWFRSFDRVKPDDANALMRKLGQHSKIWQINDSSAPARNWDCT